MLEASRLGIIVLGKEGCALKSMIEADVQVGSILDGLDLLLNPQRLKATLQF